MPSFQTSGTTGTPKTYDLTDEQIALRGQMNDANRGTGFSAVTRLFVDFAPTTSPGINYQKYSDQNPHVTVFFASAALGTLARTVAFLKDQNIEGIFSTPSGLRNYAQAINGSHTFGWIGATSERLTPGTCKAIRAGIGTNLWTWYATSEAGVLTLADGDMVETVPNVVGKPVPGVEISFDDGEIIVKSNLLIDRYHDDAATADRFKNGWYYTRDLGHMQGDLLILTGRKPYV